MANVQIDNGKFTRIANALLEALARTRITAEARQVFDAIIRRTYGWNQKYARITYRQFAEATGLTQAHVYRALRYLLAHKLIEKCSKGYFIQKDYEKWIPYAKARSSVQGVSAVQGVETYSTQGVQPTPGREYPTPHKPNNGNGSQPPKDSIKDTIKTSLSQEAQPLPNLEAEREKLEKKVKRLFPQCVSIPKGIPTEKLFLFVYRISRGEIKAESIGSPVAYMKGMLTEDVAPLLAKIQQDARAKAANAEKARQSRETIEKEREENGEVIAQLIKDFLAQMEGKHAVGV